MSARDSDELRAFLAKARGRFGSSSAAAAAIDQIESSTGDRLARLQQPDAHASPWGLAALRGRLVELSARGASGTLTTAASLVLEAQAEGEPVAWIVPWSVDTQSGTFYPPDVADSGIDLSALVVVRAPTMIAAGRAAERLLRSGAFGLVVLDFGSIGVIGLEGANRLPDQFFGRLIMLAQAHDAAVVCLTEKSMETNSLGSLVSLRVEALRSRVIDRGQGSFEITVRALKDKRRGPGWSRSIKARGPAGL